MENGVRRLFVLSIFFLALNPMLHGQSPRIDSVDPSRGPIAGGTAVSVKGANFQNATLWMDKVEIVPLAVSATEIRFVAPRHDNGIATIKAATSAGSAYGAFLYIPPRLEDLPPGYITTVAGIGSLTAVHRLATQVEIQGGSGLAYDQNGNLYVTESGKVSRVRADGFWELFAGAPGADYRHIGDGGSAIDAWIGFPRGVAVDSNGNVYIADQPRICRVDARTGIITTIAGNGISGFSGDGGPADQAQILNAAHIVIDAQGNILFTDFDDISFTPRIRKITRDGIISTVAGAAPRGFSGDGGPATQAHLDFGDGGSDFGGLAVDSQGNIYIADTGNWRIRRIDGKTGIITTVAGPIGPDASLGLLSNTVAITVDRMDNVYYSYSGVGGVSHIVKMSPSGQTIAIYGNGVGYSENGTPIGNILLGTLVQGMTIDPSGNLIYNDVSFRQERRLNFASGLLETVAGIGPHPIGESGPAIETTLGDYGVGLAFLPTGELLIGDAAHFMLRKVDRNGNISTLAGTGAPFWDTFDEVPASQAFVYPVAVKTDAAGRIFLTDTTTISRIDNDGVMRRVAGRLSGCGFSGDGGPARDAELCQPFDVALDADGNLFIADTNNNRIRRVDAQTGIITTVAGSGSVNGSEHFWQGTYCGDGGPATQACLNSPHGIAVDSVGRLYISDTGNNRLRKVDTNGVITTLEANAGVSKLVVNEVDYLYIPLSNCWINRSNGSDTSTSIAGTGQPGFSGDGGPALQAQMGNSGQANGIAISPEGDIFFQDNSHRVRAVRYGAVLAPPNAQIQITRGTPQSTITITAFDAPLEVLVLDSSGKPAPGVRVEFSAPTGRPSCTFSNGTNFIGVVTDRTGHASAICTANAQAGTYNITATPLTAAATATFALTNTPPPASIYRACKNNRSQQRTHSGPVCRQNPVAP
jgi:sugar lactone lactonase YvrE